jgi:PhnB protein
MTWGECPDAEQMPSETHKLIMHTTLAIGEAVLMGADSPPNSYKPPKGIYVSLHFKGKAEGERVFQALSESGNVQMPFQQTFWAAGFGMCVDRFGIPWMVNCE